MIGRTNAIAAGGIKTITGSITFSTARDSSTWAEDTTSNFDYAIIPANLIGFTPKLVLLAYTNVGYICAYSLEDKKVYGTSLGFNGIVFPDDSAYKIGGAGSWGYMPASLSAASATFVTLGGTQYAYVGTVKKGLWLHGDGSIRILQYRYSNATLTSPVSYIIYG